VPQRPLDINDLAFLLDMTARGVSDLVRYRFFPAPTWVSSGKVRLWSYDSVEKWAQEQSQAIRTLDELEAHIRSLRKLRY
jgi:hypothetical protein